MATGGTEQSVNSPHGDMERIGVRDKEGRGKRKRMDFHKAKDLRDAKVVKNELRILGVRSTSHRMGIVMRQRKMV